MSNILKYKKYLGSAEIDVDSNVCHGRLLYIRDVIEYSAETPKELKAAFEEAVDDYLTTCVELGREPETPCNGTFNVRISPELHMLVNQVARRENLTLNALVKDALSLRVGPHTVKHEHAHTLVVHATGAWQDMPFSDATSHPEVQAWNH